MPTYLISNRPPKDYRPSADAMAAWNAWFEGLGEHLVDRGNPVFASRAIGTNADETRLGRYTLITADDLDAAVALAEQCPVVKQGGSVEVGELTMINNGRNTIHGA